MSEVNESAFSDFEELKIGENAKSFLLETAKWAKFLAILGFIGIGFMILAALMMMVLGSVIGNSSGFSPGILGLTYLVMSVLYFFPTLYLFNFASKIKSAILNQNQQDSDLGLENLKKTFKFMGIMAIVVIAIYILAIFVGVAIGVSGI